MIVGTQVRDKRKTHRRHHKNARKILSCISLTRRSHKLDKTGVPSKMHPRDKVRAHLPASQRKKGLGEYHLEAADP